MIAVSSFRKFSEDAEYKEHQIRAFNSWLPHFSKIIYLSEYEQELASPKTVFIPSKEWPTIKDLLMWAAKCETRYSVILNADIYLSENFKLVGEKMADSSLAASFSKRYTYDHPNFKDAKITDSGLDVFVSTPQVWRKAHTQIPNSFRIGHFMWDTWMSGFLNSLLKSKCADFTHLKCVFHPNHGGRKAPHINDINTHDRYLQLSGMPGTKLR